MSSQAIEITTLDGTADALFVHPGEGVHPGVLLYSDAFGLRPAVAELAETIAARGYAVLVPNVFYRAGRAPVVELPGFIDADSRDALFGSIFPFIQQLTPEVVLRDAGAYLGWLAAAPEVADGPVGITGYCMGAAAALRAAAGYPDRVAAVAGFHGGFLATEAEDSPHAGADRIAAELYFGHADADPSLPPVQVERLSKALEAGGVRYRAEVYAGAPHGYTQRDTASHNAEADKRHRRELFALFDRVLR